MHEAVTINMSSRSSSCKYTCITHNNISGLSCHSTLPFKYNLNEIFLQSQYIHAVASANSCWPHAMKGEV